MREYKPYVPKTIGELVDLLGSMMLHSPTFTDDSGYFPGMSIDSTFLELNESLKLLRPKLGEDSYLALEELSDRMRAHFEADPEDKTEDSLKGRDCILEMEEILKASARRKPG